MRPHRLVGLAMLFLTLALGPAFGGDSAAELALKAKGLTREGRVFVDTAVEKPVLDKMREIRPVFASFVLAAEKQAAAEQLQMQSYMLDEQRAELQANLTLLTQQINAQNASMAGSRYSRMAGSMTAPLRAQQQQVQAAMNQTTNMQRVTKSQIPSAKDKGAIDEDVKRKGDAFKSALTELRPIVDEATKKYAELNADEKLKKSLGELEKTNHATMKIGPSETFAAAVKELDKAEKQFLGKRTAAPAKKKSTKAAATKK